MKSAPWRELAAAQGGMLALRQLPGVGVSRSMMRNQLARERWVSRSEHVISTFTGETTERQRMWLGVLHAGNGAVVCGLSAGKLYGLRNWDRETVTVMVPDDWSFADLEGIHFVRTRRPLGDLRATRVRGQGRLPVCQLEPALLLFAAYEHSPRTAQGVLAAAVQQRLTEPDRLRPWIDRLRPLRRSKMFQRALLDIEGGAQSLAEIDVRRMCRVTGLSMPRRQRPRTDRDGRQRFTDCEWHLADGTVVVLEIDGGFHADVERYNDDMKRQRKLTTTKRIILRCGALELRDDPESVAQDLRALGVPESSA